MTDREREKRAARKARELARRLRRREKRAAKAAPKEALAAWSRIVRSDGKCVVCGATEHLQAHHILPKERYPEFRTEIINGVCLCPTHHKYGKYSAHRNPIWFTAFLLRALPKQAIWAMDNMGSDETEKAA